MDRTRATRATRLHGYTAAQLHRYHTGTPHTHFLPGTVILLATIPTAGGALAVTRVLTARVLGFSLNNSPVGTVRQH